MVCCALIGRDCGKDCILVAVVSFYPVVAVVLAVDPLADVCRNVVASFSPCRHHCVRISCDRPPLFVLHHSSCVDLLMWFVWWEHLLCSHKLVCVILYVGTGFVGSPVCV